MFTIYSGKIIYCTCAFYKLYFEKFIIIFQITSVFLYQHNSLENSSLSTRELIDKFILNYNNNYLLEYGLTYFYSYIL